MKTPDDIKKGLECCSISHDYCGTECPYNCYANGSAKLSLLKDALAYIQQLEADNESKQKRIDELESLLAQAERERDALEERIHGECSVCVSTEKPQCATIVYTTSGPGFLGTTTGNWMALAKETRRRNNHVQNHL